MKLIKIKKIEFNNRKKQFELVCTDKNSYIFPYSKISKNLKIIERVVVDSDTEGLAFEYFLPSGKSNSILLDSVFDYNQDAEYLKKARLYNLTVKSLEILEKKNIKKSELARRMNSSMVQLGRLLDTTFYGKSTDQMLWLLRSLDYQVEFKYVKVL